MRQRNDDAFRFKPKAPRSRDGPSSLSFLSQVAREIGKAGGDLGRPSRGARGGGAKRGRGWVTARLIGSDIGPRQRRVVIKARLVALKQAGSHSAATHLRIVRDGVNREDQMAKAYCAENDVAGVKAFEKVVATIAINSASSSHPKTASISRTCATSPASSCHGWRAIVRARRRTGACEHDHAF